MRPSFHSFSCLILAVILGSNGFLSAQESFEIELEPVSDTSIFEESQNSNGAGSHLFVGSTPGGLERRFLVRFDFSELPADALVTRASLAMEMTRTRHGATPVKLHRLTAAWGEGASDAGDRGGDGDAAGPGDATWLHRFFNASMWTVPGGDFLASESAIASIGESGSYTWSDERLVNDVNTWLEGAAENHGWIAVTEGGAKRFTSRNSAVVSERPRLTLTYRSEIPLPPSRLFLDPASDTGRDGADEITNDSTPLLRGDSPTDTTVVVYADGVEAGRGPGGTGFSIPLAVLPDGVHLLTALTIGLLGRESVMTPPLAITVDTTAPTLTVAGVGGDVDPSGAERVVFIVEADEPVFGLDRTGILVEGTVRPGVSRVASEFPHDGRSHRVTVSGMEAEGMIKLTVNPSAVEDLAGNVNRSAVISSANFERYGPSPGTAFPLRFSESVAEIAGVLVPGDTDVVAFQITRGMRVRIFLESDIELSGRLLNSRLRILAGAESARSFLWEESLPPGRYFLETRPGKSSTSGEYDLSVEILSRINYQPDALIGRKRSALNGDGVYNRTARNQTLTTEVSNFNSRVSARIENDGEAEDLITLKSYGDRTTRWIVEGRNESAAILRGTWNRDLPPRGRVDIDLIPGTRKKYSGTGFMRLNAVSSDPSRRDAIQLVWKADRNPKPVGPRGMGLESGR